MFEVIKFTKEEVSGLKRLARWRSDPKVERFANRVGMPYEKFLAQKEASYQSHYLGIAGEFGVARYLGAFFDPIPRMEGDGHHPDIVWGETAKIAVKTTKWNPPIYKVTNLCEIEKATDLALCYYKEPVLTIAWIKTKEEFMEKMYMQDFNRGPRYCLGCDDA